MLKMKRKRKRTRTKHLRTYKTARAMVIDAMAKQREHRRQAHGIALLDMPLNWVCGQCVACREWAELIVGLQLKPRDYPVQTMSGNSGIAQREDGD